MIEEEEFITKQREMMEQLSEGEGLVNKLSEEYRGYSEILRRKGAELEKAQYMLRQHRNNMMIFFINALYQEQGLEPPLKYSTDKVTEEKPQ